MVADLRESSAHTFDGLGTRTYQQNLQALRSQQPRIADAIDAFAVPQVVRSALGRDGSPTVTLVAADGRRVWFGGSSMPAVSAAEMFSGASGDAGNVTLPGIGTGFEVLAILGKLPPYRAVFVIEDDRVRLKLAFHLHDYSTAMTEGRLVFARTATLGEDLVEYFERRPGHELPTRMFAVPWKRAAEAADLQRKLELAGERVLETQSRVVQKLTKSISRVPRRERSATPKVVVISTDPSPAAREWVRRAVREMERLGWGGAAAFPDAADQCHIAARLAVIEAALPEWVLVVNGFPGPLRTLLPADLPVVAWFPISGGVPGKLGAMVGPADLFFAASTVQVEALRQAGVPERAIRIGGVGGAASSTRREASTQAAVMVDIPDARAKACGINLQSHIALWEALWSVAHETVGRGDRVSSTNLLEAAEKSSGVRVQEAQVRGQWLALCRSRLLPAMRAAAVVSKLRAARFEVAVWGGGWSSLPEGGINSRGGIPRGEELCRILASIAVLVVPTQGGDGVETAMEALAVGTEVIVTGTHEEFVAAYPGLSTAAGAMVFCASMSGLASCVKSRLGGDRGSVGLPPTLSMMSFLARMRDEIRAAQRACDRPSKGNKA